MREIPLTQGKVALVDDADYEWLSQWNWYAWQSRKNSTWYARRGCGKRGPKLYMHREIAGAACGQRVDHWDRNGLNNQRGNLRFCSQSQNNANQSLASHNSSGFKGVYFDKQRSRWVAQIHQSRKHIFIGRFETATEAAFAYDQRAVQLNGEFACTNAQLGLLPC